MYNSVSKSAKQSPIFCCPSFLYIRLGSCFTCVVSHCIHVILCYTRFVSCFTFAASCFVVLSRVLYLLCCVVLLFMQFCRLDHMLELSLFAKGQLTFYGSCDAAFLRCFKNFCGFTNIFLHISFNMRNKVNKNWNRNVNFEFNVFNFR